MKHLPHYHIFFCIAVLVSGTTIAATSDRDIWEDSLSVMLLNCRSQHLPLQPLENKIHEGRAKNRPTAEIYSAVKKRHDYMLFLRDQQPDVFSRDFTKKLYDLEYSTIDHIQAVHKRSDTATLKKKEQSSFPAETSLRTHSRGDTSSIKNVTTTSPEKKQQSNGHSQQAQERRDNVDKKADKVMEKATSRAVKRMETLQRRLQKRAMKRYGAE